MRELPLAWLAVRLLVIHSFNLLQVAPASQYLYAMRSRRKKCTVRLGEMMATWRIKWTTRHQGASGMNNKNKNKWSWIRWDKFHHNHDYHDEPHKTTEVVEATRAQYFTTQTRHQFYYYHYYYYCYHYYDWASRLLACRVELAASLVAASFCGHQISKKICEISCKCVITLHHQTVMILVRLRNSISWLK